MHPATAALFTPFALGKLTLPNRIVMAPMTRSSRPAACRARTCRRTTAAAPARRRPDHHRGHDVDHPPRLQRPRVPRFHGEAPLAGWATVVDAVHAAGGLIVPQLWHIGMAREPGSAPYPDAPAVGPSGLRRRPARSRQGDDRARHRTTSSTPSPARRGDARALGFDGVELHGAHGYLIDQFFWDGTNRRDRRVRRRPRVARTSFAAEIVRRGTRGASSATSRSSSATRSGSSRTTTPSSRDAGGAGAILPRSSTPASTPSTPPRAASGCRSSRAPTSTSRAGPRSSPASRPSPSARSASITSS